MEFQFYVILHERNDSSLLLPLLLCPKSTLLHHDLNRYTHLMTGILNDQSALVYSMAQFGRIYCKIQTIQIILKIRIHDCIMLQSQEAALCSYL